MDVYGFQWLYYTTQYLPTTTYHYKEAHVCTLSSISRDVFSMEGDGPLCSEHCWESISYPRLGADLMSEVVNVAETVAVSSVERCPL